MFFSFPLLSQFSCKGYLLCLRHWFSGGLPLVFIRTYLRKQINMLHCSLTVNASSISKFKNIAVSIIHQLTLLGTPADALTTPWFVPADSAAAALAMALVFVRVTLIVCSGSFCSICSAGSSLSVCSLSKAATRCLTGSLANRLHRKQPLPH